jgi:hypothetical protein
VDLGVVAVVEPGSSQLFEQHAAAGGCRTGGASSRSGFGDRSPGAGGRRRCDGGAQNADSGCLPAGAGDDDGDDVGGVTIEGVGFEDD